MRNIDVLGILSIIFAFLIFPIGLVLGIFGLIINKKKNVSIMLPFIAIILSIAISLLFYAFLLMDPGHGYRIPEVCILEEGFTCADYLVAADGNQNEVSISLIILNNKNRTIQITKVSFKANSGDTCSWTGIEYLSHGQISEEIRTQDKCIIDNPFRKHRYDIIIEYSYLEEEDIIRTAMGEIFSSAQSPYVKVRDL
jgi:hypothetical protein